jgi:hypothetical protein
VSAVSTLLAQASEQRLSRLAMRYPERHADVAQLVEHQLPKLGVAGSSPVVRFKATSMFSSKNLERSSAE